MRPDGTRMKGLSPIVQALPYIMPRRFDAQNWASDTVDEDLIKSYIRRKRREGMSVTHMSVLVAAYYKAAMSGNDRGPDGTLYPGDALRVKELSGIPQPVEEMCPYVYEQAVSPHLAARWEGRPVQAEVVYAGFARLCAAYSWVTMEGSGGILCPIRLEEPPIWLPDLVQGLGLGCLLVAEAGLGTINQVGLTAAYLHRRGIPLQGIVLNRFQPGNPMHEDNRALCELVSGARVVACVPEGAAALDCTVEELKALYG